MNYLKKINKKEEGKKMKKIKMLGRLVELLLGIACIGFLLYELVEFVLAPFYNGGHLPTMTYYGCGVNLCVIAYLIQLENEIFS